jgi:uncharacterized C2H2 Zn-finger protein
MRKPPPELTPCPCGAGRPVLKLNAHRHTFEHSLWCPRCHRTGRSSTSDYWRAVNWNHKAMEFLKPVRDGR